MRTLDLTPLYRSTVGFDRLATLLDSALSQEGPGRSYPPYNIEKTGDDVWRVTIAVAGFTDADLTIETRDGQLVVTGKKAAAEDTGRTYLHRGIAERAFEMRFQLADHVRATGASLADGLLHVEFERLVPEALKPRRIEIAAVPARGAQAPTIEARAH